MTCPGGARWLVGGGFEQHEPGPAQPGNLELLTRGSAGTWCTSGRAGLYLLLRELKRQGARGVQLPAFLCASIVQAVEASGLAYEIYPVRRDLSCEPQPVAGVAVLLIHYFGWLNPLRTAAGPSWVEDFSMAPCSGTVVPRNPWFFSMRKIGPVPLGGWCSVETELAEEADARKLMESFRDAARLKKSYLESTAAEVEPGVEQRYLALYRLVEQGLEELPLDAALPDGSMAWIRALELESSRRRRLENWRALDAALGDRVERLLPEPAESEVPLGLVIRLPEGRRDPIRAALAADRIFCPVHWPLPEVVDARRFPEADALSKSLLTLPVDQRYDTDTMRYLAERLIHYLGS